MLLLQAQKKNWEEKCAWAGESYRKDDLILLKNTDLFLLFNHYDPKRNIAEAPSMQYE